MIKFAGFFFTNIDVMDGIEAGVPSSHLTFKILSDKSLIANCCSEIILPTFSLLVSSVDICMRCAQAAISADGN